MINYSEQIEKFNKNVSIFCSSQNWCKKFKDNNSPVFYREQKPQTCFYQTSSSCSSETKSGQETSVRRLLLCLSCSAPLLYCCLNRDFNLCRHYIISINNYNNYICSYANINNGSGSPVSSLIVSLYNTHLTNIIVCLHSR